MVIPILLCSNSDHTFILQVAIHTLWLGMRLDEATDLPRLHHQLLPNELETEKWFDQVKNKTKKVTIFNVRAIYDELS